jgi:SNF2 family DNA or RNA helicase
VLAVPQELEHQSQMNLHDYQIVARDFLRGRDRAALLLDMGLGKTAAALSALEPRHLPVLVVAPKRVAEHVWTAETKLWRPDLTISLAAGDPGQRRAALDSGADIVVLGRDNFRDALGSKQFRTLIIDESSGFKTRASVRWKTAKKLIAQSSIPHVWELTGTPTPNGLMDLWAQIYLLDGGERLGTNITGFRGRYFRPGRQIANGVIVSWDIREGAEEQIWGLIEDIALSMKTEGRLRLPPVTHNVVEVDLPPESVEVYRRLKNTMVADLRDIFGGEVHTAKNAAVLTSKLSQVSAGFMYVDEADLRGGEYTTLHREKVNAVKEIVEGTGSPVLVFYRFVAERELLQEAFPEAVEAREKGAIEAWNAGQQAARPSGTDRARRDPLHPRKQHS